MSDEIDEIVGEFLVESLENLERFDRDLLALEERPGDRELLSSTFRTLHTVKGTCGFLGFGALEAVAHAGEHLLSRLRDGDLVMTPDIAAALLATGDAVRGILASIEATGAEGDGDHSALVERLRRLQAPAPAGPPPAAEAEAEAPEVPRLGAILAERGAATADDVALAAAEQALGDPRPIGEILVEHGAVTEDVLRDALQAQTDVRGARAADSTIRVDVGLLDSLMTLVGELVLARNQIVQVTAGRDDAALQAATQRLDLITTELQAGVMTTRMQPVGTVWSRFPRVVRDLARACGKQVRVEMDGAGTELDRTILEAIKDPLTHLVRNAVDHGIEGPEARRAAGKDPEGTLRLRARHEGGRVHVEITDDGAGIDAAALRRTAVDKGIVPADVAGRMSDRDALGLIFAPGFSTAEAVTNVSGRGVGMDVVKTNIEAVGGTIDVRTSAGRGTTFEVKIPLTLAIIPALVVTTGGERYAIPQASLVELVRLEGEAALDRIERVHAAPVYRRRGELLPLVDLADELGVDRRPRAGIVHIVVLRADATRFGLVVDHVEDTQEIVVKPLGALLDDVPVFAGATIMGDGRVALILDAVGLAERARLLAGGAEPAAGGARTAGPAADALPEQLLVADVAGRRVALPLALVERLEEVPAAAVERAGHQEVVQHRSGILPLVRLAAALGYDVGPDTALDAVLDDVRGTVLDDVRGTVLDVVVAVTGGRRVGLVVDRTVDIVDAVDTAGRLLPSGTPSDGWRRGSLVIDGRVTDVIDLAGLVGPAAPGAAGVAAPIPAPIPAPGPTSAEAGT